MITHLRPVIVEGPHRAPQEGGPIDIGDLVQIGLQVVEETGDLPFGQVQFMIDLLVHKGQPLSQAPEIIRHQLGQNDVQVLDRPPGEQHAYKLDQVLDPDLDRIEDLDHQVDHLFNSLYNEVLQGLPNLFDSDFDPVYGLFDLVCDIGRRPHNDMLDLVYNMTDGVGTGMPDI